VKARITVTFEYEINPESYPDGSTHAEMIAIDVENFRDIDGLINVMQSHELTVVGEIAQEVVPEGGEW
jgi:hypothetical protein